jgi:hypothetical protein
MRRGWRASAKVGAERVVAIGSDGTILLALLLSSRAAPSCRARE